MKLIPQNTDLHNDKAFVLLSAELQDHVYARLAMVREIVAAPSVSDGVKAIAARHRGMRGCGRGTIRNFYYAFMRTGDWHELLDKARAGRGHYRVLSQEALPLGFCEWLGSQWSLRQRGKFRAAWVDLKAQYRRWRDGHEDAAVPGYAQCPPARPDTLLPEGWTEGNLRRIAKQHASRPARKLINIGPKAMANEFSYSVPTTRAGVEVGEFYLFDDCWNDFRALYRGKGSRILTLHALDLASGCNILRGHKPTVENEQHVEERLKEREMLFLVGALLSNIGFRAAGTTFICEKGTATVRKEDAEFLDRLTDGAIRVKLGPAGGGQGVAGLFAERGGGNPRWKAPIESFFNLLHNRCDNMVEFPGQTGKNSRLDCPEGLALMERTDEAMWRAMRVLTPERQQLIRFNLLRYEQAAEAIDARVEVCNTRRDHELEGWMQSGHVVPAFRLHANMDFIPFALTQGMAPDQLERLRLLLTSDPQLTGEVRLSPREVFDAGADRLCRFKPAQTAQWLARLEGTERPVKRGLIDIGVPEINPDEPLSYGPTVRDFQGNEDAMRQDDKYLVRVNPFDSRVAWLYDAKGGWRGVARRQAVRGTRADTEALQRHFKAKAIIQSGFVQEARQLAAPLTAAADAVAANNARVIQEHRNELAAPERALDARARKEEKDFTSLGGVENAPAPRTGVSVEEMNQL